MRRWTTSLVLAGVILAAVAVVLAGCGGQKRTIPTHSGQSFLNQLDKIGEQFDNGSCSGAQDKVASLASQVRQLPSSVDAEVKRNLQAGVARLAVLVSRNCQRATPTNTTPTTVPTVTVPTTTVPTTTVPATPTGPTGPTTTPTTPTTTPTSPGGTTGPGNGGGGGVTVPGTGAGGAGDNSGGDSGQGGGG
ncbi:MAG TPA: hypothetical protein VGF74_03425 [Thermoleophilaceae bacterium]|jgi:hypothetical protein